jgi:hypothetical protein
MATQINAILGSNVEKNGDIFIQMKGEAEKPYVIVFNRGCVAGLVIPLVGQMQRSREEFGDPTEFQPATLTGSQVYLDPHGYKHVILILDHGLPIPLALDEKSAPGLQAVLQNLIASRKLRPSPKFN